ncbi:DNA ligase 4 [Ramazzottius varieornatus]|nr:DNA ligase 4 [Ramazzottius varieornatus]
MDVLREWFVSAFQVSSMSICFCSRLPVFVRRTRTPSSVRLSGFHSLWIIAGRMAVERSAKYTRFVALCEGISKLGTSKDRKRNLLHNFVEGWRMSYQQAYPSNPQPASEMFFPFLRLLLPEADRDRPAYGMKETVLARMFIQELSLVKGGKASETLLHWTKNKPQGADHREVADFAGVAYHVLQDRLSKDGYETGMSIYDINKFLDELGEANGVGGENRKERTNRAFREMLRQLERLEWKWLIRIILKDARLNMGKECILTVCYPDAAELYDATTSLSGVLNLY